MTERHTREFVCGSNDSEHVHVDFSILGVIFSHPSSHSEEEVAWWDAVSVQWVTERVLGPVTQLETLAGVGIGLWD